MLQQKTKPPKFFLANYTKIRNTIRNNCYSTSTAFFQPSDFFTLMYRDGHVPTYDTDG